MIIYTLKEKDLNIRLFCNGHIGMNFCLQVTAEEGMKNIKHAKSTNSNKEIIKRNYQKHQEVIQLEN